MSTPVLLEMNAAESAALAQELEAAGVPFDGPTTAEALDGVAIATFIITVTPVLTPAIVAIIQALRGSRVIVKGPNGSVDASNASEPQIRAALGTLTPETGQGSPPERPGEG